ncbi:MAG: NAD-dependent epimerase/dehydratase family protein [Anaerolineae bacterium]|nr:NAD-dependent epimerase/dehydratase family protein [Anaerolineae bacterium]
MIQDAILITGANGELGHALIDHLTAHGRGPIITLDVRPPDAFVAERVACSVLGDICDEALIAGLFGDYEFAQAFHFAAMLSRAAEQHPFRAHAINVEGTLNLLRSLYDQTRRSGRPGQFLFPSSIAVYGLASPEEKRANPLLSEGVFLSPVTMYGVNKRYCELLGDYFTRHSGGALDFRCLRYPGLISAETLPSGGTSDYGPEMLHAAAQGQPYESFARADTTIPFMAMPDAVKALNLLAAAPASALSRRTYNVTAFSISAGEIAQRAAAAFPGAHITYAPVEGRQRILDSWPAAVDDSAARRDWGWLPDYGVDAAFNDYLIPAITAHYQNQSADC